jgi:hypothetical protein
VEDFMNHPKTGELEQLAVEYAESCDNESGGFLTHQLEAIRKKAFLAGYRAAKDGHKHCLAVLARKALEKLK